MKRKFNSVTLNYIAPCNSNQQLNISRCSLRIKLKVCSSRCLDYLENDIQHTHNHQSTVIYKSCDTLHDWLLFCSSPIISCMSYWGNTHKIHTASVQTIQIQAITIIISCPYLSQAQPMLEHYCILTVANLLRYSFCNFLYRATYNLRPWVIFSACYLSNHNVP